MRRYLQFVVFRIFVMIVMPLTFIDMIILFKLGLTKHMPSHALLLILSGVLFAVALIVRFGNFFESEIQGDEFAHPIYKNKIKEFLESSAQIEDANFELKKSIADISGRQSSANLLLEEVSLALSASEHRLDTFESNINELLELSGICQMIIDYEGKIYQLNRRYREFIGFDPVGMNISEVLAHGGSYDHRIVEKLTGRDRRFSGLVNHRNVGGISLVKIHSNRLGSGMYLIGCEAVSERIAEKSAALLQNREIEYINKITLSLAIGGGTNEMLVNISKNISLLFDIAELAIVQESGGIWSKMHSMGHLYEDDIPVDRIREYIRRGTVGEQCEEIVLNLYSNEYERIYMLLSTKSLNKDDSVILRLFEKQAAMAIQRSKDYEKLRNLFFSTVFALVDVIEAKDKYTEGHSYRVSHYAVELAKKLYYSKEDIDKLETAGVLHDLGKVSIPRAILQKDGKLTEEEFEEVKRHPLDGFKIIENIDIDYRIKQAVAYHHVRYDLSGYPENHGLKEQPEFAAIIAIVDAFDAMTSRRSYSNELSMEEALEELRRCSGTHFAPHLVDAMIELCGEKDLLQTTNQRTWESEEIYERHRIDD